MPAPARIETARLILTAPALGDAAEIFARYASDPDVTRYLTWPRHTTLAATHAFLGFSDAEWSRNGVGPYLLRFRDDARLLGGTGLQIDDEGHGMTGYVLAQDAWGQGFATEALGAMVDLARALGLPRIYAYCHPAHEASIHVLVKGGLVRDDARAVRTVFPNLGPGDVVTLCFARTFVAADRLPAGP